MDTQAASADGATILHRTFQSPGQSGFSILEVLIAIIILSMGMLGAVGMQAAAMQANKETRNQAAAATLGRDLAERMRGNHTIAIKTLAADNPYIFDATLTGIVATPSVNCFTTGCPTVKDAASWDVADWQTRVQTALPTPRVNVCFDKDPFDSAGKPRWVCTNDGNVTVLKMSWTRSNTSGTLEFAANTGIPMIVIPLTAGSSQ
jgi:type IV pilus assembly protein PilV